MREPQNKPMNLTIRRETEGGPAEDLVSLWVGWFDSEQDLTEYTSWQYDEDGNATSRFSQHSGLGWFDHDLEEVSFFGDRPAAPLDALSGHSYVESFRHAVADVLEREREAWNSLVLVYDCAYEPNRAHPSRASRLRFLGTFRYSKDAGPDDPNFRVRVAE